MGVITAITAITGATDLLKDKFGNKPLEQKDFKLNQYDTEQKDDYSSYVFGLLIAMLIIFVLVKLS